MLKIKWINAKTKQHTLTSLNITLFFFKSNYICFGDNNALCHRTELAMVMSDGWYDSRGVVVKINRFISIARDKKLSRLFKCRFDWKIHLSNIVAHSGGHSFRVRANKLIFQYTSDRVELSNGWERNIGGDNCSRAFSASILCGFCWWVSVIAWKYHFLSNQLRIAATLICFSNGLLIAWLTPILPLLKSDDTPLASGPVSLQEVSWLGSLTSIGGMVGALVLRPFTTYVGCKRMMMVLAIPMVVSTLMPVSKPIFANFHKKNLRINDWQLFFPV